MHLYRAAGNLLVRLVPLPPTFVEIEGRGSEVVGLIKGLFLDPYLPLKAPENRGFGFQEPL